MVFNLSLYWVQSIWRFKNVAIKYGNSIGRWGQGLRAGILKHDRSCFYDCITILNRCTSVRTSIRLIQLRSSYSLVTIHCLVLEEYSPKTRPTLKCLKLSQIVLFRHDQNIRLFPAGSGPSEYRHLIQSYNNLSITLSQTANSSVL